MGYEIGFKNDKFPYDDGIIWYGGREFSYLFDALKASDDTVVIDNDTLSVNIDTIKYVNDINGALWKNKNYVQLIVLYALGEEYADEFYDNLSVWEKSDIRVLFYNSSSIGLSRCLLELFENGHYGIVQDIAEVYAYMIENDIKTFEVYASY